MANNLVWKTPSGDDLSNFDYLCAGITGPEIEIRKRREAAEFDVNRERETPGPFSFHENNEHHREDDDDYDRVNFGCGLVCDCC